MRTLKYELITSSSAKQIWPIVTDINNYHKYIKYCLKAKLKGSFREGSTWYDWSTVMFLPLKINHKITKVTPNKNIVYKIKLPFGNILQSILITESTQTKINLEVVINFPNSLIDKTLGNIVFMRNRKMLSSTMDNFKNTFPVQ